MLFLFLSGKDANNGRMINITKNILFRGGSRTAATSKMEHFVIIANGLAVNYYHKVLHPGCYSSPRSASVIDSSQFVKLLGTHFDNKTNFKNHIGNLCAEANTMLSALVNVPH